MLTKPSHLLILLVLLAGSFLTSSVPARAAQTFVVTRRNDPTPNGCQIDDCSLREAIIAANAAPGADTIVLNEGGYILARQGEDQTAFNGDLDITDSLTITGAGATRTTIDGNSYRTRNRVFDIFTCRWW
jgi:hypothetical protein